MFSIQKDVFGNKCNQCDAELEDFRGYVTCKDDARVCGPCAEVWASDYAHDAALLNALHVVLECTANERAKEAIRRENSQS